MASKVYDPTKITVYPDHSTLCDAFKAHRNRSDASEHAAYLPLRDWFQRVALEANLCLSTVHLIELAGWDDRETVDEMARWYGGLPIVWVRLIDSANEFEQEETTKMAVGAARDSAARPFAPSLLTAFRSLDQAAVAALLAAREPELALVQAARTPRWRDLWVTRYINPFIDNLVRIAINRHECRARDGWTEQMGRDDVAINVRNSLLSLAASADRRLRQRQDSAYAASNVVDTAVPGLVVDLYEREPTVMPLFHMEQRFNAGAVARMERGEIRNAQPSNKLRGALASSFGDYMHLVGGAYCDVFTCDGPVSQWLGDLRPTLGLGRQLAVSGYPGGARTFVRDLMATWP
jgi:hypothetical protein